MRLPRVRHFPVAVVAGAALLAGCGPTVSPGESHPAPTALMLHVNPGAAVDQGQLLTATTGWVISGARLLTTSDSGSGWTDVTPSSGTDAPLLTAFFLNPALAWAVARSSQLNWAADKAPDPVHVI